MTPSIIFVSLIFVGISWLVSAVLKSKFKKYSNVLLANGLSGKQIAEKMLKENGIYNVEVVATPGSLTDHYNPAIKRVNLSPEVYEGRSIVAAAVAAHECGHAVQDAVGYNPLELPTKLVPAVQFSSMVLNWVLLIGVIFAAYGNATLLLIAIALMAVTVLFSLVTLPVEFDASKRALEWLQTSNVANADEYPKTKDALKWAATTYVVAALAAVITFIQYIMLYMSRRN